MDLAERLLPFFEKAGISPDLSTLQKIAQILQVRLVTLDEAVDKAGFFFKDDVYPDPEALIAKNLTAKESAELAKRTYELLAGISEISHDSAEQPMRDLAEEMNVKVGQLFHVVRVAVTGQRISPPLFESMEIIGREKSLARLDKAINILENMP
jgi:glutamyl-tRNA synthetase